MSVKTLELVGFFLFVFRSNTFSVFGECSSSVGGSLGLLYKKEKMQLGDLHNLPASLY